MAGSRLETLFDELKAVAVEIDDALGSAHEVPGPTAGAAADPAVDPGAGSAAAPTIAERAAGYARTHPWRVLLGAVAFGYLVGRLGRGRTP